MNRKNSISAIILAKDEEERIARAIQSVSFADEVIVVDNGSTDGTVGLAKSLHATVMVKKENDFSLLRNAGSHSAKFPWLLYIDADEEVPQELQKEIMESVKKDIPAYFIRRDNYYLGKHWPTQDKMIRLIKKERLLSWKGIVHEHPDIEGKIGELRTPLIHTTHRTIREMVDKTNIWSENEAELRFRASHPKMAWWRFFRVMWGAFFTSYIREQGWKAGTAGLIESMYQAFSVFITYAKLWEKQQKA